MNKLGYYICGEHRFTSKMQAMIHAAQTGDPIRWYFSDAEWNRVQWTIEPELTLDELYDARTRQLREQYDYIMICYSGGADSHNIVQSFLRQGLHIDEIVTLWPREVSEKFVDWSGKSLDTSNNVVEYKLNTVHRLEEIKQQSPNTKITDIDTSKYLLQGIGSEDDTSWLETRNDCLNLSGLSNFNVLNFKEVRNQLDKDKSTAFIVGVDKPKLSLRADKVYLYFNDKGTNMNTAKEHLREYPNVTPIYFYWDADFPEIIVKQAHTVLKYLKMNPQMQAIWRSEDPKMRRQLQEEVMRVLLYPSTWSTKYWQIKKSTADLDNEFDYFFTRGWKGTHEHTTWVSSVATVLKKINTFVVRNPDGSIYGIKPFFSNYHYIGNLKDV